MTKSDPTAAATRGAFPATGKRPPARLAFVLLILAAFFLQSFALQVHLHGLPQTAMAADGLYAVQTSDTGQPADESNCPICQATIAAGHYLVPIAFGLPTLSGTAWLAPPAATRTANWTRSHHWHGRAPPLSR
jgi:hypothetical protein